MAFNATRVILSALLILAVNGRPELFYVALRWMVFGVGAYGAYLAGERGQTTWAALFGVVVLVYNPVFPVELNWTIQPLVHIATAVIMMTSIGAVRYEESPREEREPVVVKFPPRKRI